MYPSRHSSHYNSHTRTSDAADVAAATLFSSEPELSGEGEPESRLVRRGANGCAEGWGGRNPATVQSGISFRSLVSSALFCLAFFLRTKKECDRGKTGEKMFCILVLFTKLKNPHQSKSWKHNCRYSTLTFVPDNI